MSNINNADSFGPIFIEKVLEIVSIGSTVLEFGSGIGTAELQKSYNVISIEHDAQFIDLSNPNLIHAPIKNDWYDVDIIRQKSLHEYDAMIIDGPPGGLKAGIRLGILKHLDLFNFNLPIFVDDVHRISEKLLFRVLSEGKLAKMFDSTFNRKFGIIYK